MMEKGYKLKAFGLLLLSFIMGGGLFVTMYASGNEVIEDNQRMYMVSHTEYRYGEAGQVVVRLVDFQDDPIAVDNCTATILYPNKTYYVQNALMNNTNTITGDHYYSFTTPASGPEGVYEYQATCTYAVGTKTKSATNSFHLSSAFNTVQAQLTSVSGNITEFRTEVQANVSQILTAIGGINTSSAINHSAELAVINANVLAVNGTLVSFVADTQGRLSEINTSNAATQSAVAQLQLTVNQINTTVNSVLSQVNQMTTTLDSVNATVTATYNYFTVAQPWFPSTEPGQNYTFVQAIDKLMLTSANGFANVDARFNQTQLAIANVQTSVDNLSLEFTSFEQDVQTNFTQVLGAVSAISVANYTSILNQINTTTVDTYSYVTGTLALNINSVLTQLGVINATVNRIEQNTVAINSTVSQILQNQQDQVYISTYSG